MGHQYLDREKTDMDKSNVSLGRRRAFVWGHAESEQMEGHGPEGSTDRSTIKVKAAK